MDSQSSQVFRSVERSKAAMSSFDQSHADHASKLAENGSRHNSSNEASLANVCIPKPELVIRRADLQLDFSYLPGEIGEEFSEVLGHRIIDAPPMTVIRVYDGVYGAAKDESGKLQTGGLQQCIRKLDRALVHSYPIEIHVVHRSYTDEAEFVIREPGWRGEIHVHPVKDFGSRPDAHSDYVRELSLRLPADIVHLHITDTRLAALVAEKSERTGLAVTFHNGLVTDQCELSVSAVRSTDVQAMLEIVRKHLRSNGLFSGALEAAKEIVSKVQRRLFQTTPYASAVYDAAVGHADRSRFVAAGLCSVSSHSQIEFAERPSAVIGDPMDTAQFDPAAVTESRKQEIRRELAVGPETRVLLCHGRVHSLKGQHFLPAIAAELERISEADFKIVIVGPWHERTYVEDIHSRITELNVGHRFVILDGRPNEYVRDALAISDVMLFPTRIEALGGASIEAGLMKVPVVGHRVGGVPEVVVDGSTGYLLSIGDTAGMAERVSKLLADDQLRLSMGMRAREHCVDTFNSINVATRYVELVYGPQVVGATRADR